MWDCLTVKESLCKFIYIIQVETDGDIFKLLPTGENLPLTKIKFIKALIFPCLQQVFFKELAQKLETVNLKMPIAY